MDMLLNELNSLLAGGSWTVLAAALLTGIGLSFNPCMAAMLPLAAGSSRRGGYLGFIGFSAGFVLTLTSLGFVSGGLGRVLALPARSWTLILGVLYAVLGLILLNPLLPPLPIKFVGFYIPRVKLPKAKLAFSRGGLNPAMLGSLFALAPSPCTIPVILAVNAYVVAGGQAVFGGMVLAAFAVGHSLPLALVYLPVWKRLARLSALLRPVAGGAMLLLAWYFLFAQPDFFSHSGHSVHTQHR